MISLSRIILSLGRWTSKHFISPLLCQENAYPVCALRIAGPKDFVYWVLSFQPPHLRTGLGWTQHPLPLGLLEKATIRVSSWWQSPQSQHYGLSSFQHSYYLCGIPLLSAYGSSSFFGAHIIRLDGRIVPDRAFQHNPDQDQLRQGCWYRP